MPPHPNRSRISPPRANKSSSDLESAKDKGGSLHKYGCVLLPLPGDVSKVLQGWAKDHINPAHLAPDGIEEESHITLKYGFTQDDVFDAIKAILTRHGPIRATLGRLSMFPDTGDGEVLKVDVASPDLQLLYKVLSDSFECVDKFYPNYKPHATIAYLKPGYVKGYLNRGKLVEGKQLVLDKAIFSTPTRDKHTIVLDGKKAMSWMNETSGGALVKPPKQPKVRLKSYKERFSRLTKNTKLM